MSTTDKIVNYYEFKGSTPNWDQLRKRFNGNVTRFGGPYFPANSEIEGEFLQYCEVNNLNPHKKTIVEYSKQALGKHRFLFLCLKDDEEDCVRRDSKDFIDFSEACPGGGAFGICGNGARQIGKVPIASGGVLKLGTAGILFTLFPQVPRIVLISRVVAETILKAEATGCEIRETNEDDACQLLITSETRGPARIGTARMGRLCPVCGKAKMFAGSTERYFHEEDLGREDFQVCTRYFADNVGEFQINNGFPIVSKKIFDLFVELDAKGLSAYSTDPPIQDALVQVRV